MFSVKEKFRRVSKKSNTLTHLSHGKPVKSNLKKLQLMEPLFIKSRLSKL